MKKIAIHQNPGSYSDRWIETCKKKSINYRSVNCFSSKIIDTLTSFSAFLWHWQNRIPKDIITAKRIIPAIEKMGVKVFPNTATCYHYDDKIAQKYLLEAISAPVAATNIFYNQEKAMYWLQNASFPFVFKLSLGAGSANVHLVTTKKQASRLIKKAFSSGFAPSPNYLNDFSTKLRKHRSLLEYFSVLMRIPSILRKIHTYNNLIGRERGYIYFQEFIPNNTFDTRITVVGNRAFGFRRFVRPKDFRASGSGNLDYNPKNISKEAVKIAFKVTEQICAQSLAFDFVKSREGKYLIIEISYCYMAEAVFNCPGYWDKKLEWHEGHIWPQDAILEDLITDL